MARRALSKMPEKKLAVLMKGEVGKDFPEPEIEQGEPTRNLRALKKTGKSFFNLWRSRVDNYGHIVYSH